MSPDGIPAHTSWHMEKNSPNKDVLTANSIVTGPVTRDMVHARARERALNAGRSPLQVSQVDYEDARRELTGESDVDRQEAMLYSMPEAKTGDIVPDSNGHQVPESPNEDEDIEGSNASAQLVEDGINEAERDQMLQAAREAEKRN
jgi:hypothetical protein